MGRCPTKELQQLLRHWRQGLLRSDHHGDIGVRHQIADFQHHQGPLLRQSANQALWKQ